MSVSGLNGVENQLGRCRKHSVWLITGGGGWGWCSDSNSISWRITSWIQSGGVQIGAGITQLNFVGTGNTFAVNGTTVDYKYGRW